jgi:hypothetical protein
MDQRSQNKMSIKPRRMAKDIFDGEVGLKKWEKE